jgi:hypothetical protein
MNTAQQFENAVKALQGFASTSRNLTRAQRRHIIGVVAEAKSPAARASATSVPTLGIAALSAMVSGLASELHHVQSRVRANNPDLYQSALEQTKRDLEALEKDEDASDEDREKARKALLRLGSMKGSTSGLRPMSRDEQAVFAKSDPRGQSLRGPRRAVARGTSNCLPPDGCSPRRLAELEAELARMSEVQ